VANAHNLRRRNGLVCSTDNNKQHNKDYFKLMFNMSFFAFSASENGRYFKFFPVFKTKFSVLHFGIIYSTKFQSSLRPPSSSHAAVN